MKRLVWVVVVLIVAGTDRLSPHVDATDVRTNRNLKKNRIHGDYYLGNQPDPIILRVDEEPDTGVSSDTRKGEKTNDSSDDSEGEGTSSERHSPYDHINATMVMKKLKGGKPSEVYNPDKRGKEHDGDSTNPEKQERPNAKSPSVQSKGATKSSGSTKQRKKKAEEYDSTKDSSSSSKKKSKLQDESTSKNKSDTRKTKGSKGEKNDKKEAKGDGSDTGGSGASGTCLSHAASAILDALPHVKTLNPERCCEQNTGIAAYLTHATVDSDGGSGLSRFWQEAYDTIAKASATHGVCFVFVAASTTDTSELEQTMYDMLVTVSTMVRQTMQRGDGPHRNPKIPCSLKLSP